jgi:hypothetical protein
VAIKALDAKGDVSTVWKINGLRGRLLGDMEPVCRDAEQRQERDPHRDQPERLPEPVEDSFEHGFS